METFTGGLEDLHGGGLETIILQSWIRAPEYSTFPRGRFGSQLRVFDANFVGDLPREPPGVPWGGARGIVEQLHDLQPLPPKPLGNI